MKKSPAPKLNLDETTLRLLDDTELLLVVAGAKKGSTSHGDWGGSDG